MSDQESMKFEEFYQLARAIEAEIGRVIVGQEEVVRHVLIAMLAGQHVLLEGMPGLGKTQLIKTLSQVLDLKFSRIQFTPDLMPADITGTDILEDDPESGRKIKTFQEGPIFCNLLLADEINRATPKTQSAMLEAMQEKQITAANRTYMLEPPFFAMATQNPIEQEGTYPLPEAQLDRFMFKLLVNLPPKQDTLEIIRRTTRISVPKASKIADGEQILRMGELARSTAIPTHLEEFIVDLMYASHPKLSHADNPNMLVENNEAPAIVKQYVRDLGGVSPRAAQAMATAAKINALLDGRFNGSFDDVIAVAPAIFRHRLLVNYEAMADGVSTDAITDHIISAVCQKHGLKPKKATLFTERRPEPTRLTQDTARLPGNFPVQEEGSQLAEEPAMEEPGQEQNIPANDTGVDAGDQSAPQEQQPGRGSLASRLAGRRGRGGNSRG